ncbi:MAG TPA: acetylornithine transaminase, partial [Armatimonadetes bacterium]|nr:acetylornithine transaminase [Armatimonadota bacterium]
MTFDEIVAWDDEYVIHTYARLPIAFVRGQGVKLWDVHGKEYLDFLGGIAVAAAGHSHPRIVKAIQEQAAKLIHTSNLYYIPLQAQLARRLYDLSGGYKSFFCNSGAEANEAAIKLARKYAKAKLGDGHYEIISTIGSFHGRTYGALTATGQEKYHHGFEPLLPGIVHVPYNDVDAIASAISERTCAVMLEPIQGESGVRIPHDDYLPRVAQLCREHGILLILDEVQTGLGRTGKLWGHEHYGVKPDIFTLAKSIGGCVPMGVMLAMPEVAQAFEPGNHASTFGGNFLACATAMAFLDVLIDEKLVENAARMGALFMEQLQKLAHDTGLIKEVRGKGLMIAIEFHNGIAKDIQNQLLQRGLIVNAIGDHIIRFLPPLIITEDDINVALAIL